MLFERIQPYPNPHAIEPRHRGFQFNPTPLHYATRFHVVNVTTKGRMASDVNGKSPYKEGP
jgi:hypothetical protein